MKLLSRIAPAFFRLVHDTFRDDAFVALSRLTDNSLVAGKPTLTLVSLIQAAEASCPKNTAQSARALLDQLLLQVDSLRQWRHKWLAHIDLAEALAPTPLPSVRVKRGEIDEALRLTREIMALFAAYLGKQRYDYDSVVVFGGAEDLLKALTRP